MAIVSISKIQVRRGQKNQGSGVPQLASGEFGWAVDARELYIGNGSVAEGAPAVGNTRILTEHDDLFFAFQGTLSELSYEYKTDSADIDVGITRPLQDRLDDRVSIRSFGATGDGSNQTQLIQNAINLLFLNPLTVTDPTSKVILWFEPGEYVVDSTIFLPPFVTIVGAGAEKTVIQHTGSGAVFETVNSTFIGTPEQDSVQNQSRHIRIDGLTIITDNKNTAFQLVNCRNSSFSNLKIKGGWTNGERDFTDKCFEFVNLSSVVTCHSNTFENIQVENFSYSVYADGDIYNNIWHKCQFIKSEYGIVFGKDADIGTVGQLTGPRNNVIQNCVFDDIDINAVWVANGKYNVSRDNWYYDVSNDGGSNLSSTKYPVILFGRDENGTMVYDFTNISEGDWFDRSEDSDTSVTGSYVSEVASRSFTNFGYTNKIELTQLSQPSQLFRLPIDDVAGYEIDYLYRSNLENATRSGTIRVVANLNTDQTQITDDYDYTGDPAWAESLAFSINLFDENSDGFVDTAAVMAVNSLLNDNADLYYRVKIK